MDQEKKDTYQLNLNVTKDEEVVIQKLHESLALFKQLSNEDLTYVNKFHDGINMCLHVMTMISYNKMFSH